MKYKSKEFENSFRPIEIYFDREMKGSLRIDIPEEGKKWIFIPPSKKHISTLQSANTANFLITNFNTVAPHLL